MKSILLVILYKQTVSTSVTILSFCEKCIEFHKKTILYIWDNSPINENNFQKLIELGLEYKYVHTPENISLATIYNRVLSCADNNKLIHIFDQDTIITPSYFNLMYNAEQQEQDVALFIPYVLHGNKIMSPGKYEFYKGVYINELSLGKIRSKRIIGIASGMTIRSSVYNKLKFDENLKLYGIDTKFFLDYSKLYDYIYVIDYSLVHSLSQFEKESYTIKKKRFDSYVKSSRYIALKQSGYIAYLICCLLTFIKSVLFRLQHL